MVNKECTLKSRTRGLSVLWRILLAPQQPVATTPLAAAASPAASPWLSEIAKPSPCCVGRLQNS